MASGEFAVESVGQHELEAFSLNRSVTVRIDNSQEVTRELSSGVAVGGGYIALSSTFHFVAFDNFSVGLVSMDTVVSRCEGAPKIGDRLVSIACGDSLAWNRSLCQFEGGINGVGKLNLRSNPSLCLGPELSVITITVHPAMRRPAVSAATQGSSNMSAVACSSPLERVKATVT